MDISSRVFHKILGKVELVSKKSTDINTFYIVQWNNHSGPITVQSRSTLQKYIEHIGDFEARSTNNYFCEKSQEKDKEKVINSSQASFLVDVFTQYDNRQSKLNNKTLLSKSPIHIDDTFSGSDFAGTISGGSSPSKTNNTKFNHKVFFSFNDKVEDKNEEINENGDKSMLNGKKVSNKHDDNLINNISNGEIVSDIQNLASSEHSKKQNENKPTLVISHNDESSSDNVEPMEECITSPSSTYHSYGDTSPVVGSYEEWKLKIVNWIREDEKKGKGKRNWEALEIIDDIDLHSKQYFVGYDTETRLMQFIENHEIPDSEKHKVEALQKVKLQCNT